jgi:uracil-DNA glycosylase
MNKKTDVATPLYTDLSGTKFEKLRQIYAKWENCQRCFLHTVRGELKGGQWVPRKEITFGEGNPDHPYGSVLIVGEAPGKEEDETGVPFTGLSGQYLNQMLANVSDNKSIQELFKWFNKAPRGDSVKGEQNRKHFHQQMMEWRHTEFFFTNSLCCRPPENRTPTPGEISACWERLYNVILVVDPIVIIAVGSTAMTAVFHKKTMITKYVGHIMQVDVPGVVGPVSYPVVPIFHPSYLMRMADHKQEGGDYIKSIKGLTRAMQLVDLLRNKHYGIPVPERIVNSG